MKISKTIILLSFILMAFAGGDNKSYYTIPQVPWTIFSCDIDIDGDVDVFFGHSYSSNSDWGGVSLLTNQGNGYFELTDSLNHNNGFSIVQGNNIDDNNYIDLFGRHQSSNPHKENIEIFYNYGLSQFDSSNVFFLYQNNVVIDDYSSGDLENDGDIDIVFSCNNDFFWGIIYNDGTGNFSEPEYFDLSFPPLDITCADLNGDERADVVVAGGEIEVYFSYETGFQQQLLGNTLPWSSSYSLLISDFDNDNDNDVILSSTSNSNHSNVYMFENLGNMQFYEHPYFEFSPFCQYGHITDFNNDSLPDMIFTASDNSGLHIFYNQGNFQLAQHKYIPIETSNAMLRRVDCADFDSNNYNDIVLIKSWGAPYEGNAMFLFNDGQGNFLDNPITEIQHPKSEIQKSIKCYPNPFAELTNVEFSIRQKEKISLKIHDITGKEIKNLTTKIYSPGKYKLEWNGTDKNGKEVKAGLYLISLKAGRQVHAKRVMLIK